MIRRISLAVIFTFFICFSAYAADATSERSKTPPAAPYSESDSDTDENTSDKSSSNFVAQDAGTDSSKAMLDEKTRYLQVPTIGPDLHLMQDRRVHVKLDTDVKYDSNIFLTKDATSSDVITTISPGVYAYAGNSNYLLTGYYTADVLIFGQHSKEDRVNQTINASAELFKNGKIKLNISDTLRPTSEQANSESQPYIRRVGNDWKNTVRYEISDKTALAFTYEQLLQYYITTSYKGYNYMQHLLSPVFYYKLSPKLSVTAEYILGITNYMGGNDYNSVYNQGRLGIEGILSEKSRVFFRAGYQYRNYQKSDVKNTGWFVMEGVYDYAYSPKLNFQFVVSSSLDESIYSNAAYFESMNFYLKSNYKVLDNLNLETYGLYVNSNYPKPVTGAPDKARSDNLFGAGTTLTYKFRPWISAYAACAYKIRESNIRVQQYKDATVSGGVDIYF